MPSPNAETSDDALGLSRQDIEQLFPKAAIALAARCAMRVAPLFVRNFQHKGKILRKHIVAVESSSWITALYARDSLILSPTNIKAIANTARAAAEDADDQCAANAATTAAAAIEAASAAIAASDHVTARIVTEVERAFSFSALAASAAYTGNADGLTDAGRQASACARAAARTDYELLKGYVEDRVPPQFFARPLWSNRHKAPNGWDLVLSNWKAALKDIGLPEIWFRHDRMLRGETIDWEPIKLWIVQAWETVQVEDAKSAGQQVDPAPVTQPISEVPPVGLNADRLTLEDFRILPHWAAVALAIRCAMRVSPEFGINGGFEYWGQAARGRVIAVESAVWNAATAIYATLNVPADAAVAAYDGYILAVDAANEVRVQNPGRNTNEYRISYAARAVARAAKAAAYAIYADSDLSNPAVRSGFPFVEDDDGKDNVARVIEIAFTGYLFAASAAGPDTVFGERVKMDYSWLRKFGTGELSTDFSEFLNLPLWFPLVMSPEWGELLRVWAKALQDVRLPEIYSRHLMMIKGEPIDYVQCQEWVNAHRGEVLSLGQKPTREIVEAVEGNWLVAMAANLVGLPDAQAQNVSKTTETGSAKSRKQDHNDAPKHKEGGNALTSKPGVVNQQEPLTDGAIPAALPDRFAGTDLLGRDDLAQVLAAMFDAPQQATPFTVAILGEWGAGKTTLKDLIKTHLKQDRHRRFFIAEFNTWEYEHTANIRAGLAQEVVKGLTNNFGWFSRSRLIVRYAFKEYRAELVWLLLKFIALPASMVVLGLEALNIINPEKLVAGAWAGLSVGVFVFATTAWKNLKIILEHPLSAKLETYLKLPAYGEHLGQVPIIRRQVQNLCDLVIPQHSADANTPAVGDRLIVFVDDLDRCSSDCIINTLDAVRLVMDIPGTIVVLFMDHRIAMKAVAEKYKELADSVRDENAIARDYIGKIVQLPIILPVSDPENVKGYIRALLFRSAKTAKDTSASATPAHVEVSPLTPAGGESEAPDPSLSGAGTVRQSAPGVKEVAIPRPAPSLAQPPMATATTPAASSVAAIPAEPEQALKASAQRLYAIQEEMLDTAGDRDAFIAYADLFHLTNPRQLLRLRNSFRVLKGLMATRSKARIVPASETEIVQSLLMLFWLEFLHELKPEPRKAYYAWVWQNGEAKNKDRKRQLDDEEQKLARKIKVEMERQFGLDYFQNELAVKLKERAKGLVLPYHDDVESHEVTSMVFVQSNTPSSTSVP